MKKLIFLVLSLLGPQLIECQNYQVYFAGDEPQGQQLNNPFGSPLPVTQSPFSSSPPPNQFQHPTQNEVLGNFFNGRVPSSEQPLLTPFVNNRFQQHPLPQHQPQTQQLSQQGQQQSLFPLTNNYLSPPVSTSIPRQTHFFGNNYDFFRQFHQPQPHQQQQVQQNNIFQQQQQQQQPLRSVTPSTSTLLNNFFNTGGTTPLVSPSTTQQTPSSFTTPNQYFSTGQNLNNNNNNNNNAYTFSIGQDQNPSSPVEYSSSSTTPQEPEPTHRIPTHRTPISYPLTVVKHTQEYIPAQPEQNSIYNNNGYEEAAKALGLSHGLRVVTTESLSSNPTVSIATAAEAAPFPPNQISSTVPPPPLPFGEPSPSLTPEEIISPYSPEPSTPLGPQITQEFETTTTTPTPPTTPEELPSTTLPTLNVISRTTGRSVGRFRTPVQAVVSSTEAPRVIVVPYNNNNNNRQRQPLYRQANRVVSVNDIDLPPATRPPPTITTTTPPPPSTTTSTTPQPFPVQNYQEEVLSVQREPSGQQLLSHQQSHQQNQNQQGQFGHQFGGGQGHQFSQGQGLYNQNSQGHGLYNFNNLTPGLLYTNTNGAYQPYYNSQAQQQHHQQQQQPVGLEEIEPQIIEFNIPHKKIPIPETPISEINDQHHQVFNPFRPIGFNEVPEVTERPDQPVIIVTQSTTSLAPSPEPPSPSAISARQQDSSQGEVIRVGPKGRILKKRRRLHPQPAQSQQSQRPVLISQSPAVPSRQSPQSVLPPYQQVQRAIRPETPPPPATTYRPSLNSVQDEGDDEVGGRVEKVTTYRSRFRYSPKTSTESTPSASSPSSVSVASASAAPPTGDQAQLIASRLKSLERQIRFKNRNKNSK